MCADNADLDHVFAIVCDVCNKPMGTWIQVYWGMAMCEECAEKHALKQLPLDPAEPVLTQCDIAGHDWIDVWFSGYYKCRRCGLIDLQ